MKNIKYRIKLEYNIQKSVEYFMHIYIYIVRECVSRSQRASVEKSRCIREQSESYEKENRVYRKL